MITHVTQTLPALEALAFTSAYDSRHNVKAYLGARSSRLNVLRVTKSGRVMGRRGELPSAEVLTVTHGDRQFHIVHFTYEPVGGWASLKKVEA